MEDDRNVEPAGEVTRLLREWSAGDRSALEKLLPLVYDELRRRAGAYLRQERAGHTLQPTALVHEAYLKLVGGETIAWKDRAHFFGVAARAMRQVLVDHARARNAAKRGEGQVLVALDAAEGASTPPRNLDLLDLDRALSKLASLDERQSRLVELRLFAGLTIEESADVLEISHATVSREWRHAEAWLQREMAGRP
ncbi:MAG TPA: sigma-70 family RNA polymerase sigma factor [Thermoanaerobaculia bacterium]|nr:sigma-70 family RNA polymerase sigma factor [Thermoanaerobaculia bacterium]